jgi:hypothetical protein
MSEITTADRHMSYTMTDREFCGENGVGAKSWRCKAPNFREQLGAKRRWDAVDPPGMGSGDVTSGNF